MTAFLASARQKLLGLLLVVVILAFFAFTIACYNKMFTPVVTVHLHTDAVGSQMQNSSDVKAHGLVVGEVTQIKADFSGAELTLALQPQYADQIPADATARLLPKSLFGERYVALSYDPDDHGQPLVDGDTIRQDRSEEALGVEQALNNLLPVLQAVQPQKLSATLTAVATALQGKGAEIGDTVRQVNDFVQRLNPQLPALTDDLRKLVHVSRLYNDALPDITATLTNLRTTTNTIATQRANLSNLYNTVSGTSANLQNFLAANEQNLIGVSKSLQPTLQLMQRYSPQVPCFFNSLASLVPKADKAFGKGTNKPGLHMKIQITVNRGPYKAGQDTPRYEDDRGPRCYNVTPKPDPFPQYPGDGPVRDGSTHPPAPRSQSDGPLPGANEGESMTSQSSAQSNSNSSSTAPQSAGNAEYGPPNSKAEQDLIRTLSAPALGVKAKQVPGWSTLLLGPLMRGAEVSYQ